MDIIFNNHPQQIDQASLQVMLNDLVGEKQQGIAVAVNDNVVPRSQWQSYLLRQNDHVLVIKATPGG